MEVNEFQLMLLEEIKIPIGLLEDFFVDLKKNPKRELNFDEILATVHNIKNSTAAVGLTRISIFAANFKKLLTKMAHGSVAPTAGIIDLLLTCNDILKIYILSLSKNLHANVNTSKVDHKIDSIINLESIEENMDQIEYLMQKSGISIRAIKSQNITFKEALAKEVTAKQALHELQTLYPSSTKSSQMDQEQTEPESNDKANQNKPEIIKARYGNRKFYSLDN